MKFHASVLRFFRNATQSPLHKCQASSFCQMLHLKKFQPLNLCVVWAFIAYFSTELLQEDNELFFATPSLGLGADPCLLDPCGSLPCGSGLLTILGPTAFTQPPHPGRLPTDLPCRKFFGSLAGSSPHPCLQDYSKPIA